MNRSDSPQSNRNISLESPKPIQRSWGAYVSFGFAIAGNILLAWFFWSAVRSHVWYGEILENMGPLMLVAEFLAIYAGGIVSGKQVEAERSFEGRELAPSPQKRRIALLMVLTLAGLLVGWAIQREWLAYFFIASLLAKYFGHRAVRSHPMTVISLVWFLASLAVIVIPESFLQTVLQVMDSPPGTVHTFLVWGSIYFAVFTVIIAILFLKELSTTRNRKIV